MKSPLSLLPVRALFAFAALYDGLLGLAFIFAGPAVFDRAGIQPPNHWGYVHFPAGLLVVFGLMFLAIAMRPIQNRNLIPYGILLKICFISTVLWHWTHGGIPTLWKPFALFDLLFIVLFLCAYRQIAARGQTSPH